VTARTVVVDNVLLPVKETPPSLKLFAGKHQENRLRAAAFCPEDLKAVCAGRSEHVPTLSRFAKEKKVIHSHPLFNHKP
jgi:hypothetical protein